MKKRKPEQQRAAVRRIRLRTFTQSRWELSVPLRIGASEIFEAAGVVSRRVWLFGPERRERDEMATGVS